MITRRECCYSDIGFLSLSLVGGAFVGFIFLSEEEEGGGERNLLGVCDFKRGECYSDIGFLSLDLVFRGGEGFE